MLVYTQRPFSLPGSASFEAVLGLNFHGTGDNVNKADLTKLIADKADISNASAARALDAALEGIAAALADGDQVALLGFGTFTVKDRGMGIPAADLPYVFDKFHRAGNAVKAGVDGTGLGLAIARRLAELQGWSIAIESDEGKGTTATVTIPGGAA